MRIFTIEKERKTKEQRVARQSGDCDIVKLITFQSNAEYEEKKSF